MANQKLSLLVFAIILVACIWAVPACDSGKDESETRTDDDDDSPGNNPDDDDDDDYSGDETWTFIIYLAADNNLETSALIDIDEILSADHTDSVNTVIIFDGTETGDSYYALAQKGKLDLRAKPGELNMGDSQTLVNSVVWAMNSFPADRTALILWSHGTGWHKGEQVPVLKDTCQDYSDDNDWLTNDELDQALAQIREKTGVLTLDLLGFDACLMQMIEIAYYLKDDVYILVGSQESIGLTGWPYKPILNALNDSPFFNAAQLGRTIVDEFVKTPDATLSAVDLTKIEPLTAAISDLADELIVLGGVKNQSIRTALNETLYFDNYDYIDLGDFAKNILAAGLDEAVFVRANAVISTLSEAAFYSKAGYSSYNSATGLSIYFPDPYYSNFATGYRDMAFSLDTSWDELVEIDL